ncbi:MAG: Kelch repeat-containing protein [Bacteroidota bacterium]
MVSRQTTLLLAVFFVCMQSVLPAQGWSQLQTTNDPPARRNASAIYDPANNRMILFGGKGSSGDLNDLWSLNLTTLLWEPITPATQTIPAPRFTHNAMFDSLRNRMIVWSGQGSGFYNDVWAFDFATSTWEQLWANGNVPGAPNIRYGTTAGFDPIERQLINVSGFTSEGRFQDTWAFHVESLQWSERTMSPHPVKRCLHAGCFADDRRTLVLYGGQTDGIPFLDDIWALDADSFEWANLTPPTKPTGRHFSSIVYAGNGNVMMFGGQTAQGVSGEVWRFSLDTNSWEILSSTSPQPDARYGHVAVYVPSRNSMVVFGGFSSNIVNDTWEYSLSPVTQVEPPQTPSAFRLEQNFPNPFNPTTNFEFGIADLGFVTLKVYDLLGREVTTLVNETLSPGVHRRTWDASAFPSGVYSYRLQSADFVQTRTMLFLK